MSQKDFEKLLPQMEALDHASVKLPNLPVDVVVQEAENLAVWAAEDQEALTGKGINWKQTVNELPARAGALRYAQALWMKERYDREEAVKEWNNVSPDAYQMRDDLLADLRFAFRKQPELISRVRAIQAGVGAADMIQDLSDISVLGKAHPEELKKINFDMKLLDQAAERSNDLGELLARSNGSRLDNSKAKDTRDRAFTLLKETVDEVRDFGKYVFRKDPERYKGYISRYRR